MPTTTAGYNFWEGLSLAELAQLQDVRPIQRTTDLQPDFWPEDEVQSFMAILKDWRSEEKDQSERQD